MVVPIVMVCGESFCYIVETRMEVGATSEASRDYVQDKQYAAGAGHTGAAMFMDGL